jgi:NADPH:quinone reductase-like Zn-dependent oxidoreductase
MSGGTGAQIFQAIILGPLFSRVGGRAVRALSASSNPKDLAAVKELLESGMIRPVIDRRYPLSQAAEALRYLGAGHARGKVVITT